MANFLIYPFKTMRITQNYNGTTSHKPHSTGNPKDYPLDEGADDGGRSWMYCDCDELEIVRITGVGTKGTNTIWLTSTKTVVFADLTTDYATIMAIHPNDDDLSKLKVGQKFKRYDKMFREGTDGATGNHIHFAVGKGKITGNGWTQNSKGKWVLTTTGGPIKPEKAMAVDKSFTTVKEKQGLAFKSLAAVEKEYKNKPVEYKVNLDPQYKHLNCREKPSTESKTTAQFVNGTKLEITQTKTAEGLKWGKCSQGWVALKFCKKV